VSRTYKDRPRKFNPEPWDIDLIKLDRYTYIDSPTKKTKKRKEVDTEDHWMSTPSWWTRLMMTRPERRSNRLLEVAVVKSIDIEDLEDFDFPDLGHKPHVYYW
jgi:hypothetical protein